MGYVYYNWNLAESAPEISDQQFIAHGHTHNVCGNGIAESSSKIQAFIELNSPRYLGFGSIDPAMVLGRHTHIDFIVVGADLDNGELVNYVNATGKGPQRSGILIDDSMARLKAFSQRIAGAEWLFQLCTSVGAFDSYGPQEYSADSDTLDRVLGESLTEECLYAFSKHLRFNTIVERAGMLKQRFDLLVITTNHGPIIRDIDFELVRPNRIFVSATPEAKPIEWHLAKLGYEVNQRHMLGTSFFNAEIADAA